MTGEGVAQAQEGPVAPPLEPSVLDAQSGCPVDAIEVEYRGRRPPEKDAAGDKTALKLFCPGGVFSLRSPWKGGKK